MVMMTGAPIQQIGICRSQCFDADRFGLARFENGMVARV
jgi:hypothetical protein